MFGSTKKILKMLNELTYEMRAIRIIITSLCQDLNTTIPNFEVVIPEPEEAPEPKPALEPLIIQGRPKITRKPSIYNRTIPEEFNNIMDEVQHSFDQAAKFADDHTMVEQDDVYDSYYRKLYGEACLALRELYFISTHKRYRRGIRSSGLGDLTKKIFSHEEWVGPIPTLSNILSCRAFTYHGPSGKLNYTASAATIKQHLDAIKAYTADNYTKTPK